jgi:hypothetical protein
MGLNISANLQQTADPSQLVLLDTTPLYSAANPNGWNNSSTDYTSNVITVYLNNIIYYPAPANVPPMNLGNIQIMPAVSSLPFNIGQGYVLTPSLFGLDSFLDGIISCVYTVNTETYTIAQAGLNFPSEFAVGDAIRDENTATLLGVVLTVAVGSMVLTSITGEAFTPGHGLENQNSNTLATNDTATATFNNNTYTYDIQFEYAAQVEYLMGKKLARIDLTECGCDCDEVKKLFDEVMVPLVVSNAQCGAAQNRSCLNSLAICQQNVC